MIKSKVVDPQGAVLFELQQFMKDPDYKLSLRIAAFFLGISHQNICDYLSDKRLPSMRSAEKIIKFLTLVEEISLAWAIILKTEDLESREAQKEAGKFFEAYGICIDSPAFNRIIEERNISYDAMTKRLTALFLREAKRIKERPELVAALRKKFMDFKRSGEAVKTQLAELRAKNKNKD